MHIAKADISAHKKIEELCNALKDMGYIDASPRGHKAYYDHLVIKEGKIHTGMLCACNTEYMEGFIDCNAYTPNGTEEEAVRLFLILAEMRDDTNDSKWLVWSDAPYDDIKIIRRNICYKGVAYCDEDEEWQTYSYELYRDATPLEVAQAFKEGRI